MSKLFIIFSMLFVFSCAEQTATDGSQVKDVKIGNTASDKKVVSHEKIIVPEFKQEILKPEEVSPPLESIKGLDVMVESYHLGQNLSTEQIRDNLKLKQKIIRGTFDIKELCRLSLAKHWATLKEGQRDEFVGLMTRLLETKAIFSKEQLRGENKLYSIKYSKEVFDDKEKKKSTVKTNMHIPKDKLNLAITYKLLLTPYGWKIYDVIVDEASLLSNYKFQFDRIIQKNGFDDLIQRMTSKLKKMG
jgi:phospholipid transport system substrate-binding protein